LRKYLIAQGAAAGLVMLGTIAAQAASAQGVGGLSPPAGVVSATPATDTPHLKSADDNPTQQIRQLVQCGSTMYAVGSFTTIVRESTTYTRDNIFSFSATAPYTVTSWAPDVVGTSTNSSGDINSIAFSGGNCADAYIGGSFTSVNGTSVKNIAEISTTTGNVVTAFAHSAAGSVQTLLGADGHILAGGYFTSINGSSADPYFTSLNPATGKDDGFLKLNISGNYNFPGVSSNATRVFNQSLSHGGQLDLVMGDFTSVGGLPRQQIFMLNLATSPATVTAWSSPQWDGSAGEATPSDPTAGYPYECATVEPFYIQAAAWSPDDSEIYIGTTGYHPNGWPTGATPRNGLCDAAAAFPATQAEVLDTWINYTGCDSLYAAAADANAAYFAGHERFSMNSGDCDALGPNAYNAPGLEGLQPSTGDLYLNWAGSAGYYIRDRGLGADDLLATSAGLWIASDNYDGSQMCGGSQNLSGICFLPYTK
jgi:hypothetical protein